MQTQILLQKNVGIEDVELFTEACRILGKAGLCSRFCSLCQIAKTMAEKHVNEQTIDRING